MTFRLIKEAQIKSTLSADDIQMLEVVKSALGKDSIAAVMESYVPSPEDYSTWLDVIQGYARDSGANLRKKGEFFDIAGAVLENDPAQPPYSMQEAIMKKLWLDFQAQKHMKKIAGVAQAAEEEERVAQAARTMVGCEEEEDGATINAGRERMAQEERFRQQRAQRRRDDDDLWATRHIKNPLRRADILASVEEEEFGDEDLGVDEEDPEADMVADGSVDFDDQLDGTTDDEAFADSAARDSMSADDGDGDVPWWDAEDDTDEAAFPKFAARQGEDRPSDLADVPEDDTFDPRASEYNDSFGTRPPPSFENEEKTAPKKQMSVLQQMLTLPKNSINTLVRDVEAEGAAAWKQHAKPQNPHPSGSMAFKAWERGMTKAMKEQLGVNKEPAKAAPKKKAKR